MSICTTCANKPLCKQWSFSMAKCSDYDPVFNAIETAVNTYGIEKQLTVFFGEIGELMTAVADCRRGRDTPDHVAEEMADVLICCKQIMYALGITKRDVLEWQDRKLRRLAQNLAAEPEAPKEETGATTQAAERIIDNLEACAKLTAEDCKRCGYYGINGCHKYLKHDAAALLRKEPDT